MTGRPTRAEALMGTVATVELGVAGQLDQPERALSAVFDWLHAVDRRFSTYRCDSEVNRLDRAEITAAGASADLRSVLDACADLWAATGGYFDANATGRFDPSGYVKGWSVQVASERLTAAGVVDHLIDVGGDIQTRGRPAPGELWQIGVRHPFDPAAVCFVVAGTDLAVATSGTYERGRHVIDPLTGRPADALCSVTVVGTDLAAADAYATAALAMGYRAVSWLAALEGYESAVVGRTGDCFVSAGFPGPAVSVGTSNTGATAAFRVGSNP